MQAAIQPVSPNPHDLADAAHAAAREQALASAQPRAAVHAGEGRPQRRRRSWRHPNQGGIDRSRWMDVQQRQVGDFRILAGALDGPDGGFLAAVEVHRVGACGDAEVIFSSEQISGGHRFAAAALALRHAFDVGHQAVRLHKSLDA
jgi:hypothetical protein